MRLDWKTDEICGSIPDRLLKVVRRIGNRPAVRMGKEVLTYDGLERSSAALSQTLLCKLGEKQEPIAVFSAHGLPAIVAMVGVLRAGKFYTVLDPAHPPIRQTAILDGLGTRLILCDRLNQSAVRDLASGRAEILVLADEIENATPMRPLPHISPSDPAAVFFTSGSTGAPKGVIRSHQMFLMEARTDGIRRQTTPEDRQSSLFRYCFGASAPDVFGGLLNGACIYPFDVSIQGYSQLADWLADMQITILHAPVAYFRHFVEKLEFRPNFPALRIVHLGGSAVYRRDFENFCNKFAPDCLLEHRFSATETGNLTRMDFDRSTKFHGNVLPAGYVTEGKQILILDEGGNSLGSGRIGEIAVRSQYLASGYWRRPDLTATAFRTDPLDPAVRIYRCGDLGRLNPDGLLEHLGRKDTQVKVRGYRVDVREVEAALLEFPAVQNAAVLPEALQNGELRLLAYLSPRPGSLPTVSELRAFLARHLPDYMQPAAFVVLNELPLTSSGKVNTRLLPRPASSRLRLDALFVPPRTDLERKLAELWAELLELEQVGVLDNFFELGGQSLLTARMAARLEEELNVFIPLGDLLNEPTVAGLALRIQRGDFETARLDAAPNYRADRETR
jgi:amino acid adenylation domain-containing protein